MNKHTTAIHVVHKTLLPIENNKTNCFVVRMLASNLANLTWLQTQNHQIQTEMGLRKIVKCEFVLFF
jgi:hypothetical protein